MLARLTGPSLCIWYDASTFRECTSRSLPFTRTLLHASATVYLLRSRHASDTICEQSVREERPPLQCTHLTDPVGSPHSRRLLVWLSTAHVRRHSFFVRAPYAALQRAVCARTHASYEAVFGWLGTFAKYSSYIRCASAYTTARC